MHTLHSSCTGNCASDSQYPRGFQPFAHITHIFSKRIYRNHNGYIYKHHSLEKCALKETCERCVQCVQSLEPRINKGWELHGYVCAMLCLLCKKRLKGNTT